MARGENIYFVLILLINILGNTFESEFISSPSQELTDWIPLTTERSARLLEDHHSKKSAKRIVFDQFSDVQKTEKDLENIKQILNLLKDYLEFITNRQALPILDKNELPVAKQRNIQIIESNSEKSAQETIKIPVFDLKSQNYLQLKSKGDNTANHYRVYESVNDRNGNFMNSQNINKIFDNSKLKYNVTDLNDDNYEKSRRFQKTSRGRNFMSSSNFNSLNHLPTDPILSLVLSHHGHYLRGNIGRNVGYRNLYSYLASNSNINNLPFGSYKVFSDLD